MNVVRLGFAAGYSDEGKVFVIFSCQFAEAPDEAEGYAAIGEVLEVYVTYKDYAPRPLFCLVLRHASAAYRCQLSHITGSNGYSLKC